jgi:hypothetical protein
MALAGEAQRQSELYVGASATSVAVGSNKLWEARTPSYCGRPVQMLAGRALPVPGPHRLGVRRNRLCFSPGEPGAHPFWYGRALPQGTSPAGPCCARSGLGYMHCTAPRWAAPGLCVLVGASHDLAALRVFAVAPFPARAGQSQDSFPPL